MFKLFKAELKKIFYKPSILVVVGLIILMLAASIFIYKPNTKDEEYVKFDDVARQYGNNANVGNYYNFFITSSSGGLKQHSDQDIVEAENYVNYYLLEEDVIKNLNDTWAEVKKLYDNNSFSDYVSLYDTWNDAKTNSKPYEEDARTDMINKRNQLKTALTNFMNLYDGYVKSTETKFLVTPENNKLLYNTHLQKMKALFTSAETNGGDDPDKFIISGIKNGDYFSNVQKDLNKLLPFTPEKSVVEYTATVLAETKNRNQALFDKIYKYCFGDPEVDGDTGKQYSNEIDDIKTIKNYITNYYLNSQYAFNIAVQSIKISGLSKYTALNITQFKNFESANLYQMKEANAKNKFMYENQTYAYSYADPFSIVQPSNTKLNGFDYSYFALRLCTFFITIYIVVLAAGTIAGEQASGTLKLLAIRPFNRNKLLTAKLLATLAVGAIFIFVSAVASLVIGGITYGVESAYILAVFNASSAFVISPVLLYILAMFTMLIEVAFYGILSIFISTVFKSNIAAVAISALIFFVSLVLNVIAVNLPLIGLFPFVNVNLYKYFGASFLTYSSATNLLQLILTPEVFAGSSFWLSIIIYALTIGIVTTVTYVIFRKRDIK